MSRRILKLLAIAAGIAGCNRQPANAPATAPASAPAETHARVIESTTAPAGPVAIWISQHRYEFPPVTMYLQNMGDEVAADLVSNDPPEAANDDYGGNSLFLQLLMVPGEAGSLDGSQWKVQPPNEDDGHSTGGIFLHGEHKILQPKEVSFSFAGTGKTVTIVLNGTFEMLDETNSNSAEEPLAVMAEIPVQVKIRQAGKRPPTPTSRPADDQ